MRVVVNAQTEVEQQEQDDNATVAPCGLTCLNGGTCQFGIKEYDINIYPEIYNVFWLPNNVDGMYCECPVGYFGTTCDVSSSPCYNDADGELLFYCFNGSTCDEIIELDGTIGYRCNCHSALKTEEAIDAVDVTVVGEPQPDGPSGATSSTTRSIDDGDEPQDFYYAGNYCQSKSTRICSSHDEFSMNGVLFCTNGGLCREDAFEGCVCPPDYYGSICENRIEEVVEQCTLNCLNGGYCRHGKKDNNPIEAIGKELEDYIKEDDDGYWHHCVCPEGYFGLQCEYQIEICGGGDDDAAGDAGDSIPHVCLHGSECVTMVDTINEDETVSTTRSSDSETAPTYLCNCKNIPEKGSQLVRYVGKYCQYRSTDICTETGTLSTSDAFCVNNGLCNSLLGDAGGGDGDSNQAHPGCTCPAGFVGSHCEFVNDGSAESPPVELPPPNGTSVVDDNNNTSAIETKSGTKLYVAAFIGARIVFVGTFVLAVLM